MKVNCFEVLLTYVIEPSCYVMDHTAIKLLGMSQTAHKLVACVGSTFSWHPVENYNSVTLILLIFYFVILLCFTAKEFKKYHLGLNPKLKVPNDIPLNEAKIPDVKLPAEFDWRSHNVVTEVKNQVTFSLCYLWGILVIKDWKVFWNACNASYMPSKRRFHHSREFPVCFITPVFSKSN